MKKFNLFKEIIVVQRQALMQAVNSSKAFGITYEGKIVYDFDAAILIFKGTIEIPKRSALMPQAPRTLNEMLGQNYQIVEDDDRVLIKAARAWQEILALNVNQSCYDDSSNDGLASFRDKELEAIGWYGDEFNIEYRDIAEVIEQSCEGVLLCIEQNEPYQFSGLGFIFDYPCARATAFDYVKNRIAQLLETEDEYTADNITGDELEAARFFGLDVKVSAI